MPGHGSNEGGDVLVGEFNFREFKTIVMIEKFIEDALFAAIAAIGFSAISNPPRNAYIYCALIAAIGHSTRFFLMQPDVGAMSIVPASTIAALVVGVLAVLLSPKAKIPAEAFLFPSLLPMIPGIYAYKTFGGAGDVPYTSFGG